MWQWKNYHQEQQPPHNNLPVRGNFNQQQPRNTMYPQWNSQWAPYQGYYTVGARPQDFDRNNTGKVGWKTAPRRKAKKSEKGETGNQQDTSKLPANVNGYPQYYRGSQYGWGQAGMYQPYGYATMFPTDRFY